jgi:hypothetical protein
MADNFETNPGTGGAVFASDDIGGVQHPRFKVQIGADGVAADVSAANPMPVTGGLTDAQLRASAVPVSGPLTDAQLRATPIPSRISAFNYPISTLNSSTTQLAAGASFTGGIESAQDQPSISILLTSDQPMTVTVRQFIDAGGTFAVPDIVFYVPASAGFARSLTINGNFCQVIAQNTGAATTTTFNLNVAYGALGDADSSGQQPVTELPLVLTGAAAQTATVNNILTPVSGTAPVSVSGYRSASVQVVSTGTAGTFIFEQSNTGGAAAGEWIPLPVFNAALVTGVPITAAITASASAIVYTFPVRCNFLRLRIVSTITGGSIRAFTRLSTEPWTPAVSLVASNAAGNLLTTATISGNPVLGAGANAIGDVGLQVRANATGAASIHHIVSAATTNVAQIKATAGRVIGYCLSNTTASWQYVKFHNVASATAGAGVVMTVGIPPNGKAECTIPHGIGFATAISRSIVTGAADTDATATTLNAVVGDIFFA